MASSLQNRADAGCGWLKEMEKELERLKYPLKFAVVCMSQGFSEVVE